MAIRLVGSQRVHAPGYRGLSGWALRQHLQAQGFIPVVAGSSEIELRSPAATSAFFERERSEVAFGERVQDLSKCDGTSSKLLDVNRINDLDRKAAVPSREGIARTYRWLLRSQAAIRLRAAPRSSFWP